MLSILRLVFIVLGGCLIGLASVWIAVEDPRLDFTPEIGPWRLVDLAPGNDPYALARSSRNGMIGLGPSEGLTFAAFATSDGHRLSSACNYRLDGPVPKDVPWTLTVSSLDWRLPDNPAGRTGFTVYDAARQMPGNTVRISFGPDLRPGDYIPTRGLDDVAVLLRVYSSAVARQPLTAAELPAIIAESCEEGRADVR